LGYFALGTIEYSSDGVADELPPTGKILYIKPVVRGDEGAAEIIAYQRLNPAFPNQSTVNQWFDEPQLEAYRALGHYIVTKLVDALGDNPPVTLEEFFDRLGSARPDYTSATAARCAFHRRLLASRRRLRDSCVLFL
jgi:hypothetical protein